MKQLEPSQQKEAVRALQDLGLSQRSACRTTRCARSVAQYTTTRIDKPNLVERLKDIAMDRRRFGYIRLTIMLRREGSVVNNKRAYRIYDAAGLQVRGRKKRGVWHVRGNVIQPVTKPNERWSLDFVSDTLSTGRRFRALTIVDDVSREYIAIKAVLCQRTLNLITAVKSPATRCLNGQLWVESRSTSSIQ